VRCRRGRSCPPCSDEFSVRQHLHQRAALLGVLGVGPVSTSAVARVSTVGGVRELIVIGAHGLCVLGRLDPLCGERPIFLPINMYSCSLT
jgi:hypothetical protein